MTCLRLRIGMVITLTIAIPLLSNRRKIDPLDAAYPALSKKMTPRGYARRLREGSRSYCIRLLDAASLSREQKHAVRQFLICMKRRLMAQRIKRHMPVCCPN